MFCKLHKLQNSLGCKLHMLRIACVANCTCCKLLVKQIARVTNCMFSKLHVLQNSLGCKLYMLQIACVANCTCCKLHMLQRACVANCMYCKLHVLQRYKVPKVQKELKCWKKGQTDRQANRVASSILELLVAEYQPSGAGGTHSLPATPNRPLNPNWPTGSGKRLTLRLFDPPINFC